MNKCKLSIILPVYNVEKFILRCLKSVFSQKLSKDVEIIIVDDESPDNSIQIAKDYITQYSSNACTKVISQANRGLGGARNTGLKNASGDYVWFVDSDDEILPNSIYYVLKNTGIDDIIIYDYEKINANGVTTSVKHYIESFKGTGFDIEKRFILSQAWTCIYRRDFLLANNIFFREKFLHEDGEFNMRAMCFAKHVSYYSQKIYRYYTQNTFSIMNTVKLKNIYDLLLYFDYARELMTDNNLNDGQTYVIKTHLLNAMGVIFLNSTKLSDDDFRTFCKVLKSEKKIIMSTLDISNINIRSRILLWVQLTLPYKRIYNFIYNKYF